MVFLADVFVPCEVCGGTRFKAECSTSRSKANIAKILDMMVDEAIRLFPTEHKLGAALWQLQQVGLGYLRLGQPATTLSGARRSGSRSRANSWARKSGEAQTLSPRRAHDRTAHR